MIYVFMNDYLAEDRGLSVQHATLVVVLFGVGGFLGQIVGGVLGQRLYNRNHRYQPLLMGGTTLLVSLP